MSVFKVICVCVLGLAVTGCATRQPFADDATVSAVSYRDSGPASLTLYTMVNNRTGGGGHSSILINASERVIFDPAGSFHADIVPERNDVLFGITPAVEQAYRSAHARSTFHVVSQTVDVTPAQAEAAYRLALNNGAVAGAFCTSATSNLLRSVPGFEGIRPSLSPTKLQGEFAKLPGVRTETYYEGDSDDLQSGIALNNAKLNQKTGG